MKLDKRKDLFIKLSPLFKSGRTIADFTEEPYSLLSHNDLQANVFSGRLAK